MNASDPARAPRNPLFKLLWFLGMGILFALVTTFTIISSKWVAALLFGVFTVYLFWSAYRQFRARS
jgi:uncharacterized membrane protein (Fun14 family)